MSQMFEPRNLLWSVFSFSLTRSQDQDIRGGIIWNLGVTGADKSFFLLNCPCKDKSVSSILYDFLGGEGGGVQPFDSE